MKKIYLLLTIILSIHFTAFGQTVQEYMVSGSAKYNSGEYKVAIEEYNKAI